jgi:hypothetical protein
VVGSESPLRLTAITYRFPASTTGSVGLFDALRRILAPVPGVETVKRMIQVVPRRPVGALPITVFALGEGTRPEIAFATDLPFDLAVGDLRLRGAARERSMINLGSGTAGGRAPGVAPEALAPRLAGHVTRIDHTGVNFPAALLDTARWEALLGALARSAALYRYPGGQPWPFILPTSDEEFSDEVYTFATWRAPKFELVYDAQANVPIIQIALGTDLPRAELEAWFPAPHGVAFPGLSEFFRAVYVEQPWAELLVRLDLYYGSTESESDWDTGRWLVQAGGRIR